MKVFSHKSKIFFVTLTVLLIFSLSAYLDYQRAVQLQKFTLINQLNILKANLEDLINSRVYSMNGLRSYIQQNPEANGKELNSYLSELFNSRDIILRNAAVLKNTTIIHVYPYETNKQALGVDLAAIDGQKETVLKVKNTRQIVLTAPVKLVQGGTGIIARLPVILNNKELKDQYWGQVSIVLNYSKIMEISGIDEFSAKNNLKIYEKAVTAKINNTVWGSQNTRVKDPVRVELNLPNMTWVLSAEPANGWTGTSWLFYSILLMGIVFAIFIAVYYYQLIKTREHLIRSEEKFRTLFNDSADANILLHRSIIIDCNQAALNLMKAAREDLIGKNLEIFLPEFQPDGSNSVQMIRHLFKHTMPEGGLKVEWVQNCLDGSELWIETVMTSLYIGRKKIQYTTWRDITERKKAEQALKRINIRLSLISRVSSSVVGTSPVTDQVNQYVNLIREAFDIDVCIVRKLQADELVLVTCSGIEREYLAERIKTGFGLSKILMETRKPVAIFDMADDPLTKDARFLVPNTYEGKSFAGAPLLIRDQCIGVLGIYLTNECRKFSDTDLEHLQIIANNIAIVLENDLLYHNMELQKKLLENELLERKRIEEELVKAKDKAEEINRLKTSFFANMSHELRTPLMGILGYSQALAGGLEDKYQKHMAQTIALSGQRLSNTVKLILDITKLESENVMPEFRIIDIREIAAECFNNFLDCSANKNLSMEYNDPGYPVWVNVDRRMLTEVINNLLNNSLKFTIKGSVNLNIYQSNDFAWITVMDTGIGISEENQAFIFDEFRQASEGLGRVYEGTGLGLTIAKRYVELMRGTIGLESRLGVGSTFAICFPISLEKYTIAEQLDSAGKETNGAVELRQWHKNILIVENDSINIDVVSTYLTPYYEYSVAKTAAAAVEMITTNSYDLVLLDINLGFGVSGLNVIHEVKKSPAHTDIPFVAMTAYAMASDKTEFLKQGCTHYIAKPFTRRELLDLLEGIFLARENAGVN